MIDDFNARVAGRLSGRHGHRAALRRVRHRVVDIGTPLAWRCPNATPADPHHVLHLVEPPADPSPPPRSTRSTPGPTRSSSTGRGWRGGRSPRAHGMTDAQCAGLTDEVAGDFRFTPFGASDASRRPSVPEVWVKDETGNVGRLPQGPPPRLDPAAPARRRDARPARRSARRWRSPRAATPPSPPPRWPRGPTGRSTSSSRTWMDDVVGAPPRRARRPGPPVRAPPDDPPGDPAMLRFREACAAGADPVHRPGPRERATASTAAAPSAGRSPTRRRPPASALDRVVVQVGGGAFAACVGAALAPGIRLDAVQAEGCAPLAAAWERMRATSSIPNAHWGELMRPVAGPALGGRRHPR